MKLASFKIKESGLLSWGVIEDEQALDVGTVLKDRHSDLRSMLAAGDYSLVEQTREKAKHYALDAIQWLPVIPNPRKILCVGLNYEDHRLETGAKVKEKPTIFTRFANSLSGHMNNIPKPAVSDEMDYEGELAVIIGKPGRYIKRNNALSHIAGYACFHDVSMRDWQRHTTQFTPGKNFPGSGPFGPWMVTADEIDDLGSLQLTTRLNGEVVQDASVATMIFDVPTIIEYCSSFTELETGDVIATGTPGGVGFKQEPPSFLKKGDTVEITITKIATLVNQVVDE